MIIHQIVTYVYDKTRSAYLLYLPGTDQIVFALQRPVNCWVMIELEITPEEYDRLEKEFS